jgi:ankyrin repeat protein
MRINVAFFSLCICSGIMFTSTIYGMQNIFFALQCGNWQQAKGLVRQDSYCINSRDENSNTPLILAAIKENPEFVAFLLEQGADPLLTTDFGTNALEITKRIRQDTLIHYQQDLDKATTVETESTDYLDFLDTKIHNLDEIITYLTAATERTAHA